MNISQDGQNLIINLQNFSIFFTSVLFFVSIIGQIVNPKKYKPWTWVKNHLLRDLTNAANKHFQEYVSEIIQNQKTMEVLLNNISSRVESIEEKNKNQDEIYATNNALSARRRIISAADDLRNGGNHSTEWYNSILEDCTRYEIFCRDHPNFQNEKARVSIQFINDCYYSFLRE